MAITREERAGIIERFASKLKYPQLFFLLASLFLVDLVIPDVIPFIDEAILGLLTMLVGMLRRGERPSEVSDDGGAREVKNVTPPDERP